MFPSHPTCVKISWHSQWFIVDGALQILFVFITAIMMVLWVPSKTDDWYSYEDVPNALAGGKPVASAIWADEELPDENEPFDCLGGGGNKVVPAQIGAREATALE